MAVLPLESLPLGFRFHPTDEELVNHYLKGKINGRTSEIGVIPEVDVCKCEPWDLPDKSVIKTADPEWFFFSPRDRKYPNGHRSNRATEAGYWKATGKDRMIKSRAALIGMKKTLVFYRGRAPKGERSNWIMHEYRTSETDFDGATGDQGTYVLCRLFRKPEERSSNTDCDEMEGIGFSPTPARPSPGDTQHAAETIEEFENPLNQEISEPDMPEDPLLLPAIAEKQPDGIERWLADEADIGATFPIKSEENHCDSKLPLDVRDHDAKLVTKINPLPDTLKQFNKPQLEPIDLDGIPWIDSPYLPYSDYFRDIYDQGSHIGLFEELQGDFSEQDGFMDAVCNNQDEFFRAVSCDQIDSAASIVLAPAHNSSVNISTGLNESGIMIRSRQRLLPENSESLDQGMAIRRIHLQNKLSVGSFCSMGSESISGRDDHFENSSACDEKALPGMAIFTEEPKPVPRWRKQKKGFGGEQGGPLLQAEAAKAGSAPVYTVFAVLLVVLLVLCVGMVWGFKILWLCR